jgi:hypothetical protein
MSKKRFFSKESEERLFNHYKKDENGNYIIEVLVPELERLFSPYDPSPLHQKDIDPAIMSMILSQIVVFPHTASVELHVHLPKKLQKRKIEDRLEQAIKHHFEYELLDSELHLERRIQKGFKTFSYAGGIFITLFGLSYILENFAPSHVIFHALAVGTSIGAWVSLWHPIETLLYDWLPLREDKKKYARLMHMNIKFKYV